MRGPRTTRQRRCKLVKIEAKMHGCKLWNMIMSKGKMSVHLYVKLSDEEHDHGELPGEAPELDEHGVRREGRRLGARLKRGCCVLHFESNVAGRAVAT